MTSDVGVYVTGGAVICIVGDMAVRFSRCLVFPTIFDLSKSSDPAVVPGGMPQESKWMKVMKKGFVRKKN
jgi:hypothetical protein